MTLSELGAAIGAKYAAVSVAIKRLERKAVSVKAIRDKQAALAARLNVAP